MMKDIVIIEITHNTDSHLKWHLLSLLLHLNGCSLSSFEA